MAELDPVKISDAAHILAIVHLPLAELGIGEAEEQRMKVQAPPPGLLTAEFDAGFRHTCGVICLPRGDLEVGVPSMVLPDLS